MPAGDLTIVANAESWAGVNQTRSPASDWFCARLISSASRYIANYLSRELFTLGGQGFSSVVSVGADAGGAFLLLSTGLGIPADNPIAPGITPDVGAGVFDLNPANPAATVIKASVDPVGFPATAKKIYVNSTTGFNPGDPINVNVYPTFNETHSGVGTSAMSLNEWPLYPAGALGSIAIGGVALMAANNGAVGYSISGGDGGPVMLDYPGGFPRAPGNVGSVYRAGYPAPPSDLEQVCIELVGLKIRERDRIGQSGKSLPNGEHTSFITGPMTQSNKDYLRNYSRKTPRWR